MRAKLTDRYQICEGTLYSKFEIVEGEIDFKAGQFFRLTLPDPAYKDNRGNKRFLGFINSPSQSKIIETVTRLGPSAFKRSFTEMPLSAQVEIDGIGGVMTLPESTDDPLVIITGGIGIVPYMSMFRLIKEQSLSHKITLIYSNTRLSWAIFMDELSSYSSDNPNFIFIPTMTQDTDWQGEKRRIDENLIKEHIPSDNSTFYISGTPRFVPTMVKTVKAIGVSQDRLKFEIFTGY